MLEDGLYGLKYTACMTAEPMPGTPWPCCATARSSAPTLGAACSSARCEFDPDAGLSKVRLQFDVPPEGTLITGFSAGPAGAVLDIVGAVEGAPPLAATVVEVEGTPVSVELTYLGPLPN